MLAKVRDKLRNIERTTTAKAYSLIPHRYELLGWLNDDGTPADSGPSSKELNLGVEKKRNVVARPAEVSIEHPAVTRADLDKMNQDAIDKAKKKAEENVTGPEEHTLTVDHVGLNEGQVEELYEVLKAPKKKTPAAKPKTKTKK